METIFIEFNPITKNEETYHWLYNLVEQYSIEIKDRGGKVKIISEIPEYQYIVLEVRENNAYNYFKGKEGRQRLRVPVFDKKELTKITTYRTLLLDIKIYPEAPNDFSLNPKEVVSKYINTQEDRVQRVAHETFYAELTHRPTGIIATCGEEASKLRNKEMAELLLKAKVYKLLREEYEEGLIETVERYF